MTSDLDDFMGDAFDDAATAIGMVTFTISGMEVAGDPIEFEGVINRVQKQESMPDEGGGFLPADDATLVAELTQFATEPDPNLDLTIGAEVFTILRIERDTVSLTFHLAHPSQP